jgi:hypothetical protein
MMFGIGRATIDAMVITFGQALNQKDAQRILDNNPEFFINYPENNTYELKHPNQYYNI